MLEDVKNIDSGLQIREASPETIKKAWEGWGEPVVSVDRLYTHRDVKGLALLSPEGEMLGLVTYAIDGARAEIVTLNAFAKGKGYGRFLLGQAEEVIIRAGVKRIRIITTNDNYKALTLYIKSGYRLINIHLYEMDRVRRIKPHIPLKSEDGIPIQDRLELEKDV